MTNQLSMILPLLDVYQRGTSLNTGTSSPTYYFSYHGNVICCCYSRKGMLQVVYVFEKVIVDSFYWYLLPTNNNLIMIKTNNDEVKTDNFSLPLAFPSGITVGATVIALRFPQSLADSNTGHNRGLV